MRDFLIVVGLGVILMRAYESKRGVEVGVFYKQGRRKFRGKEESVWICQRRDNNNN